MLRPPSPWHDVQTCTVPSTTVLLSALCCWLPLHAANVSTTGSAMIQPIGARFRLMAFISPNLSAIHLSRLASERDPIEQEQRVVVVRVAAVAVVVGRRAGVFVVEDVLQA